MISKEKTSRERLESGHRPTSFWAAAAAVVAVVVAAVAAVEAGTSRGWIGAGRSMPSMTSMVDDAARGSSEEDVGSGRGWSQRRVADVET